MLTKTILEDGTLVLDITPAKKPFPYGLCIFITLLTFLFVMISDDNIWMPIMTLALFIGWHLLRVSMREEQRIEIRENSVSNGEHVVSAPISFTLRNSMKRTLVSAIDSGSMTGNVGFSLGAAYREKLWQVCYEIELGSSPNYYKSFVKHLDRRTASDIKNAIQSKMRCDFDEQYEH